MLEDKTFLKRLKQNNLIDQQDSFSSFENILKLENTDSLLFSKMNMIDSVVNRKTKTKKRTQNENFLEKQIVKLIKEKPVWLKKSLLETLKSKGGNVESSYILKVSQLDTSQINSRIYL